jgi:hypothetical protein
MMDIQNSNLNLWDYTEIILEYNCDGNPFNDVEISAFFQNKKTTLKILGFYDGNNKWKIRFMPVEVGTWNFVTKSNIKELSDHKGIINCVGSSENVHGIVEVNGKTNFSYSDGTPYHPIGTTCYVWNLQSKKLQEKTLKTLKNSPFNKIRFCIYPKRYTFNYNEPEYYPFPGKIKEKWNDKNLDDYTPKPHHSWWDYDNFNIKYFQHIDECILQLREMKIEADLILFHPYDFGAWGFDCIPEEINNRILKYLVARLSSFRNVWWSFANEYDFFQNKCTHEWDRYMKLVQSIDPYNHLRSIHNWKTLFDYKKPWITHCSMQTSNFSKITEWFETYKKPIVIDECGYEGNIDRNWGNLTGKEMIHRFWHGFSSGAYVGHGETYINDNEELWWSKGGELVGDSPKRIDFFKKIIEELPKNSTHIKSTESHIRKTSGFGIFPEYVLYYFGNHQPSFKSINLTETDTWKIDIIDTWNMTITSAGNNFKGQCRIELPTKENIAIRVIRN